MPKIIATEAEDFTVLPADVIITVRVEETKVETIPGKNGKDPWDKLDFKFVITGVTNEAYKDAEGQNIWGGVAFRLSNSPDNKLKQWTEALLGIEISEGFELETEWFEGRSARAVVANYTRSSGGTAHKVGALLPLAGAQSAVPNQVAEVFATPTPAPAPAPAPQPTYSDVPF